MEWSKMQCGKKRMQLTKTVSVCRKGWYDKNGEDIMEWNGVKCNVGKKRLDANDKTVGIYCRIERNRKKRKENPKQLRRD